MFSNYFFRKSILILIIWFMSFFFMVGKVYAKWDVNVIVIWPYQGVEFFQLDLTFAKSTQINSPYGLFVADFNKLYKNTGIYNGFLNVMTEQGWVVRNMPVDVNSGYPGLSTVFNLGSSDEITSLFAYVELSTDPILNPPNIPLIDIEFNVGALENNAEGIETERETIPNNPINTDIIEFSADGLTHLTWQPGHPNLEQDENQCAPAAVANSLQWLEDKYPKNINIPDEHKPGIRDDSLVGKLDKNMNRQPHSTTTTYNMLTGKLTYINDNKLCDSLSIKHKNSSTPGILFPNQNKKVGCATSEINTDEIGLFDWILSELEHDEDVEVIITWNNGKGHVVDLIGGGYILGVPWLAWVHDANQGHKGGVSILDGGYGFSLVGPNLEIGVSKPGRISSAVSESLPVELSEFKSIFDNDNLHLIWLTGAEIKNAGFRLWRATKNQYDSYIPTLLRELGHTEQVNPEHDENCSTKIQGQLKAANSNQDSKLISAIGNSVESTCYSFTDTSDLSDGTYYYLLEDIDDDGKSTFHCDQIDAVTIGQGPAIDLESAINYCKEMTGSNS